MLDSTGKTRLLHTRSELRSVLSELRGGATKIGLVPTMGALHEGHLSLVQASQRECDATFVTMFVNPTQFGPQEDLDSYPRTTENDLMNLSALKVAYVFAPTNDEIYPPGFSTYVEPPAVSAPLEGKCRPGHFRGVATVVLKLFHLVPADVAYFGAKDFQQSLVIRHMVRDLNLPITIRTCPIVRDADGLAKSSRNSYLNKDERLRSLALSRCLQVAQQMVENGQRDTATIIARLRIVLTNAGITRIDYVAIRAAATLETISRVDRPACVLIAAFVGETRLIDNCLLE